MANPLLMPALSPTMAEGVLVRWHRSEGDSFRAGDLLAEVETDKAVMELEASEDGILGRILVTAEDGETTPVGAPIALILQEGEEASALESLAASLENTSPETPAPAPESAPSPETSGDKAAATASPTAESSTPQVAQAPIAPQMEKGQMEKGQIGKEQIEKEWSGETQESTVRDALRDAMAEEMRRDERVLLLGEEVAEYQGPYKVSVGLLEEFGAKRVVDTPITEHGFAGLGIGAAMAGLRPIVEFMTFNFAMQAMDQIINSAAKTRYMSGGQVTVPIVFRGPNGAAARVAAQHSQCYASWFAHIPGLVVVAPASAADAKGLLKAAVRRDDPVIFLENEILYGRKGEVPLDPDFTLPIGRARIVRSGTDLTIATFSLMVERALAAADTLADQGISAEVIDLRTLRPLDRETVVASVQRTGRLLAVEEGWPFAGIGSELCALAVEHAFDWLDAPPVRIAGADVPLPYAANLEALALPQSETIAAAARALLNRS